MRAGGHTGSPLLSQCSTPREIARRGGPARREGRLAGDGRQLRATPAANAFTRGAVGTFRCQKVPLRPVSRPAW